MPEEQTAIKTAEPLKENPNAVTTDNYQAKLAVRKKEIEEERHAATAEYEAEEKEKARRNR